MRWTYQLLIVIHLLLTTAVQSTAQPISSAVCHPETVQLSRREPVPSRKRRSGSRSGGSPRSASPTRHRSRSRARSKSSQGSESNPSSEDSGSVSKPGPPTPKKLRRGVKYPKTNLKAAELKSKDYRANAIENERDQLEWKGKYDADHIFEPRTVAYCLNNHRGNKKVNAKCVDALAVHLNQLDNLKMLRKKYNKNKNHVVTALNEHESPDKLFHPKVAQHILMHKDKIRETAKKFDNVLKGNGHCKDIDRTSGNGLRRAAERMINHAKKSPSPTDHNQSSSSNTG